MLSNPQSVGEGSCMHACVHTVCKSQRQMPNKGIDSLCPRQTLNTHCRWQTHNPTQTHIHTHTSHITVGDVFFFFLLSLSEREKGRCEASVTQCCPVWLIVCVFACVHFEIHGTNSMPNLVCVLWLAIECISAYKGDNLTLKNTGSHSSWHRPFMLKNKFAPFKKSTGTPKTFHPYSSAHGSGNTISIQQWT